MQVLGCFGQGSKVTRYRVCRASVSGNVRMVWVDTSYLETPQKSGKANGPMKNPLRKFLRRPLDQASKARYGKLE